MVIALNNAFEKAGVRKNYKFIGPAQAIYANHNRLSLVEYLYNIISDTEYSDLLDTNAMHSYAKPNVNKGYTDSIYEP